MEPRSGIFHWDQEPAEDRRSHFASTQNAAGWEGDTQSALWTPSRLEARRTAKRQRGRSLGTIATVAIGVILVLGIAAVLLVPKLVRSLVA